MTENEATLRKTIKLNPHSGHAYYQLGLLLAEDPSRIAEVEAAYRKAIELEPNNPKYIYRLGLVLHENLQRFKEAESAYRQAITPTPEDVFCYSGLISLLVQNSRPAEALSLSIKMRAMLNASQNWFGLATLDAILGNVDAAIDYLGQAAAQMNFNREWARTDPDLASIRNDPRFDDIVGSP